MIHVAADAELLYPLSLFRQSLDEELPPVTVLDGDVVPEPYRGLLVHGGDMTSRLESFHGGKIVLEVLHRSTTSEHYRREVVLRLEKSGLPVEYGAIEIALDQFPEPLRAQIVEGHLPLGGLMNAHRFAYRSQPKAFIRMGDDQTMQRLFQAPATSHFYGRCNELIGHDGETLARIVEVLRP